MKKTVDKKGIIKKLLLLQPIDIPVFHEVALRLQQMMNDNSYRIEEAIILVNEDTALASVMLRHANTTYNSGKAPITTIKNAIVRLGSQQIVNLAFTASMANSKSDNPLINTYFKKLWHHSHAVAIASSWLAVELRHDNISLDINPDEVYLAGLFHDIGKLYLLKSIDRLYSYGILHDDDNIIDDILDELNIPLGVKVMQHWNIPEIYIKSVERHAADDWKCGTNDYLVAAVRLACKIHDYVLDGQEVTKDCEALEVLEDELSLLDISDVSNVYHIVKAIAE
ncbi:MAG: HDOD domain-containing protein [Geobacteraceae bacterium]|nr:HDOD domain-containing protein [Geobacteraceae bacterium]